MTGDVLLRVYLLGDGHELGVDTTECPLLGLLPVRIMQLEEHAGPDMIHGNYQPRQKMMQRLGASYDLGLILNHTERLNGSPQLINDVAGQVSGINPQVFETFEHWHCRGQGLGELSIRN
jgi:hypothetical protein